MSIDLTNPITDHELVLMPGSPVHPTFFGWIRLLNGNRDAGYVYLTDTLEKSHLSGAKEYIVTSVPVAMLQPMLDVLRNERNLQIRFAASDDQDPDPSGFIENRPREGDDLNDARNKAILLRNGST